MKKTIIISFLILIPLTLSCMDKDNSWPKDKPVPFNSLPIEYYSDDESEPRQTLYTPSKTAQAPAPVVERPWWASGGEPSPAMVAKYQQRQSKWQFGDTIEPSPEAVAKYQQQKPEAPYVPKERKTYRSFCSLKESASYDDVHKSCFVQQLLFKHLCVQVWDRLNPIMDDNGSKAWHDFMVKLKKREINPTQTEVTMTKKDLYHRLVPFVLTDGFQCQVNNKDMVLVFKPITQNGVEGELVSTEYDLQADKAHHEHVMATFGHILNISSGMNEVWAANPHQ